MVRTQKHAIMSKREAESYSSLIGLRLEVIRLTPWWELHCSSGNSTMRWSMSRIIEKEKPLWFMKNNMNMTQEEKQLLLKDLCARLPYGVKLLCANGEVVTLVNPPITIQDDCWNFKPYLRPMSNMTEEEIDNLSEFHIWNNGEEIFPDCNCRLDNIIDAIEWLNAHHFDYRGLIEKGLALEAKEGMYKAS